MKALTLMPCMMGGGDLQQQAAGVKLCEKKPDGTEECTEIPEGDEKPYTPETATLYLLC